MFRSLGLFAGLAVLTHGLDLSGGSKGSNFELTQGYAISGSADQSLKPSGSAYVYLGGKVSQTGGRPGQGRDGEEVFPVEEPGLLSVLGNGFGANELAATGYFTAGAAAALSLWYILSTFAVPFSRRFFDTVKDSVSRLGEYDEGEGEDGDNDEDDIAEDKKKTTGKDSTEKAEPKTRRRRAISKKDDDLTALATLVLHAVRSGECMQKTICLVGKESVDEKKGKVADAFLTTLLPESVQRSSYFQILRRSIRGDISCKEFNCVHD